MFSDIISRDNGAPWGHTGFNTQGWIVNVPVSWVRISDLIATQPGVLLEHLKETGEHYSYTGDPVPHVVIWNDKKYLEDGHHRVVRAALRGQVYVEARVFDMDYVLMA